MIYKNLIVALFFIFAVYSNAVSLSAQERRDGSWLDRTLMNWNRPASGFPQQPRPARFESNDDRRCLEQVRPAANAPERALTRLGWRLYGSTESYGQTSVITALSGFDGMCRPLGFQAFVYWEGRYAGTLAPVAMDSRSNGALTDFGLVSPTDISAKFLRFNDSDALCCPSRVSTVIYKLRRDDVPVLAALNVVTEATCRPDGQTENNPDANTDSPLFGRRWNMTEINGRRVNAGEKPFIEFNARENRVSGDAGCNLFFGGYEINGSQIKFPNLASTKRACAEAEKSSLETEFLNALGEATRFELRADRLLLYASSRQILAFSASESKQTASVAGTVTYLQRIALAPYAVIKVELLDSARANVIAGQTINANGRQVPFAFEIKYDSKQINQRRSYAVRAQIFENGRLRFSGTKSLPVRWNGDSSGVEIIANMVR